MRTGTTRTGSIRAGSTCVTGTGPMTPPRAAR
jgi:hypothetical protein